MPFLSLPTFSYGRRERNETFLFCLHAKVAGKGKGGGFLVKTVPTFAPPPGIEIGKGGNFLFRRRRRFANPPFPIQITQEKRREGPSPLGSFGDENPAKLPGRKEEEEEEEEEGKQKILGGRGGEGGWMHRTLG